MKRSDLFLLRLQYIIGNISILLVAVMTFVALKCMSYRIHDLKRVRARIRNTLASSQGPWLICANHLTMIDSVILAYAMAPLGKFAFQYRLLPWNLPERENFQRNPILAAICYLSKCIPISRGGERSKIKKTLKKCTYLLEKGEPLMVFPEGGRSRTGYVDPSRFSYGVGRFVTSVPNCRVLCLYFRGDGQNSFSNLPRYGERFTVLIDSFRPETHLSGLKGQRESARQIIERLSGMEKLYFAFHRKRHCRSGNRPG